jgi:hypothetical protein
MKKDEATKGLEDLRGTLEWLKSKELLLETDVEVNGDLEITGLQKHLDGSIPILFEASGYESFWKHFSYERNVRLGQ